MLAKTNRFVGNKSVRVVLAYGNSVRQGPFQLKHKKGRHKHTRIAVVVSKKVSKQAVKRNRIRRRIYEVLRRNLDQINGPVDMVVTVYSDTVVTQSAENLQADIMKLLQRAKLLK